MLPSVRLNGRLSHVDSKDIKDNQTGQVSSFKVYHFYYDCYVPEIGMSVSHDKIKRPNHQQYISTGDTDILALYDSIPPLKPCTFTLGVSPKLSSNRAKLRLILESFKQLQ